MHLHRPYQILHVELCLRKHYKQPIRVDKAKMIENDSRKRCQNKQTMSLTLQILFLY